VILTEGNVMLLKSFLDTFNKIKEIAETLLGKRAAYALLIIMTVGVLLAGSRHVLKNAGPEVDTALLLCFVFGFIVTGYGIFTNQNIAGLGLQKGFPTGLIAGVLAALTGGIFYYASKGSCCNPEPATKILRILSASVPLGAVLGALMGWLRPSGPASVAPAAPAAGSSPDFLSFVVGFFVLLVLCVISYFIFDNMRLLVHDTQYPQGLIRFWHVSLIIISFTIIYVGLTIYLYGRADEKTDQTIRRAQTISSVIAALICAAVIFTPATLIFGTTDFEQRDNAIVCTAPAAGVACVECVAKEVCLDDPKYVNPLPGILLRTMMLILLLFVTYLCATHPRSPILSMLDRRLLPKQPPP
jgi:hypothetical protein